MNDLSQLDQIIGDILASANSLRQKANVLLPDLSSDKVDAGLKEALNTLIKQGCQDMYNQLDTLIKTL